MWNGILQNTLPNVSMRKSRQKWSISIDFFFIWKDSRCGCDVGGHVPVGVQRIPRIPQQVRPGGQIGDARLPHRPQSRRGVRSDDRQGQNAAHQDAGHGRGFDADGRARGLFRAERTTALGIHPRQHGRQGAALPTKGRQVGQRIDRGAHARHRHRFASQSRRQGRKRPAAGRPVRHEDGNGRPGAIFRYINFYIFIKYYLVI